jgi:hypothetical protein
VIGDRPNRACIGESAKLHCFPLLPFCSGVPIGVLLTERIVASVYCSNDSIVELLTTTPLFVNKTTIARVSGTTNQWFITLSWVPIADQRGPQVSPSPSIFDEELWVCLSFRCFVLLQSIKEDSLALNIASILWLASLLLI